MHRIQNVSGTKAQPETQTKGIYVKRRQEELLKRADGKKNRLNKGMRNE